MQGDEKVVTRYGNEAARNPLLTYSPLNNTIPQIVARVELQPLQVKSTSKDGNPFANFVIMERKYDTSENLFRLILMDSANFSGYKLKFNKTQVMYDDYSDTFKGMEYFPSVVGENKSVVQNKAAGLALQILSRYCYTIKYLKHQKEVLLTDLFESEATSSNPLMNQPLKHKTQSEIVLPLKDTQTESILALKNLKIETQPLEDLWTESILPLKVLNTETLQLKDLQTESSLQLKNIKTETQPLKDSLTEISLPLKDSETERSLPLKDSKTEISFPLKDSKTEISFPLKDSKTEISFPLKDSKTEITLSETEQEKLLDRDQQENVQVHTGPDNTCETRMLSLASENINFQCTTLKEKDLLSDILELDSRNTSSNVLVNEPLKSPVSENSWSNAVPHRMPDIGFQGNNNTLINTTHSHTYETQMTSPNLETVSSDVAHLENSFGSKMLKRMGWDGGGLGKHGSGIQEPISTTRVLGRFGIGHERRTNSDKYTPVDKKGKDPFKGMELFTNVQSSNMRSENSDTEEMRCKMKESNEMIYAKRKEFKETGQKIRSLKGVTDATFQDPIRVIIHNFVENSEEYELSFSRRFNNRQRKIIESVAHGYNLSIHFFGRIGNRYLVLFREHSTEAFLQYVRDQSQNYCTRKYLIIPPSMDRSLITS